MLRATLDAALAGDATVVAAGGGQSVAEVLAALRASSSTDAVLLLIGPDVPAIDRAMLLAALGPLATDLAPQRLGAIDLVAECPSDRIVATAKYLVSARSTTGQALRLG
jgi:hypothetical protein